MRNTSTLTVALLLMLSAGCTPEQPDLPPMVPVALEELGVATQSAPRTWVLTDKAGGILMGTVAGNAGELGIRFSVRGDDVVSDVRWSGVQPLAGVTVYPHEVRVSGPDGEMTIAPVEGLDAGVHGFVLEQSSSSPAAIPLTAVPAASFSQRPTLDGAIVRWKGRKGTLAAYAGAGGSATQDGLMPATSLKTRVLFLYGRSVPDDAVLDVYARVDSLRSARARRMQAVLTRAHFRTSDMLLTKATGWFRLLLDALVVDRGDTLLLPGVPWDGTYDGRVAAQSIGGLDFALGDYALTSGMLRAMARHQDTVATRRTYGRLPERMSGGVAAYGGIDVTPWFVRELYDHVTRSHDTSLVRSLYPVVRRSIEGMLRYNTDELNLVTHAEGETWMKTSKRGTRAAELQLLWYMHQLVGSFVATYLGLPAERERWAAGADSTGNSFNAVFVDTTRRVVADNVDASGRLSPDIRPNPMICLEILGSELIQQTMLRTIIETEVYPFGVGTLARSDPRFTPSGTRGAGQTDGPVWTWLHGPFVYALTRYDRQDVSYTVTSTMLRHAMERSLVGAIPQMFEARLPDVETLPAAVGLQASTHGMAEMMRALYQDYLGARIDAVSGVLSLQPKLPENLTEVDFTLPFGTQTIRLFYRITDTGAEVVARNDGARGVTLSTLWMMGDGSAWRGSTRLQGGSTIRILFTDDDMTAAGPDGDVTVSGKWRVRNFSRRQEFSGFSFATPAP